jgi:hypothetical protein
MRAATAFIAPPPPARWICQAQGDGIEASFHPLLEHRVGSVAFWSYSNEASHRSPAHFHWPYMRLAKDPLLCVHPTRIKSPPRPLREQHRPPFIMKHSPPINFFSMRWCIEICGRDVPSADSDIRGNSLLQPFCKWLIKIRLLDARGCDLLCVLSDDRLVHRGGYEEPTARFAYFRWEFLIEIPYMLAHRDLGSLHSSTLTPP